VVVVQGDLTAAATDVIVNAANERLQHGGGVAAALAAVGGEEFVADSNRWVTEHGPIGQGESAVTVAGGLPSRWVVHVVGPRYWERDNNQALLRQAVRAALDTSARIGARSVAMPAISSGVFGYPLEEAASLIASECVTWVTENPNQFTRIQLVGYDLRAADAFRAGLEAAVCGSEGF
jgi:O-acetyl-ADP-ribose deacetylase (regulator of RNase III)